MEILSLQEHKDKKQRDDCCSLEPLTFKLYIQNIFHTKLYVHYKTLGSESSLCTKTGENFQSSATSIFLVWEQNIAAISSDVLHSSGFLSATVRTYLGNLIEIPRDG